MNDGGGGEDNDPLKSCIIVPSQYSELTYCFSFFVSVAFDTSPLLCADQKVAEARLNGVTVTSADLSAAQLSPVSTEEQTDFVPFLGKGSRPAANAGTVVEFVVTPKEGQQTYVVELDVV